MTDRTHGDREHAIAREQADEIRDEGRRSLPISGLGNLRNNRKKNRQSIWTGGADGLKCRNPLK